MRRKLQLALMQGQEHINKTECSSIPDNTLLDVRRSVHHKSSTIHKENPTRCNNVAKFYYSIFIWSSTCFGRHTAHHQEPKTVLAASGFSYVEGCWTCSWWTLSGTVCLTTSKQPSTYEKPEAAGADLGSWWWAVCRPKHVELHINME